MKNENNQGDEPKSNCRKGESPSPDDGVPTTIFETHAPIIITGEGSVGVEFERNFYPLIGASTHQSSGLSLEYVEIKDQKGDLLERCHTLAQGEVCLVKVESREAGKFDEEVRVIGGTSQSPAVDFDHNEFIEIPALPERRKHFNAGRMIISLKIYRVVEGVLEDEPFHRC